MVNSLKFRKKQKDKKRDSRELSSIVKEPSFLKRDQSPKIEGGLQSAIKPSNHQEEFLNELVKKENSDMIKIPQKLIENKMKSFFLTCKKFLGLNKKKIADGIQGDLKKKINKSVKIILKDLEFRVKQLNTIEKRMEKKKIKDYRESLTAGIDFIKKGIFKIESGLDGFLFTLDEVGEKNYANFRTEVPDFKAVFDVKADLIRMNIKKNTIVKALQGCFLKKKILILLKKEISFLKDDVVDFFDSILKDSFEREIVALTNEEYKENVNLYRNYVVLSNGEIIGKYSFEFDGKKLDYINYLITEFYGEPYLNKGLKRLNNKLQDIYDLSEGIYKYYEEKGNISRKETINYLENSYFPKNKIKKDFLNFLLRITKEYFNREIKFKQDMMGEMISNMWGR